MEVGRRRRSFEEGSSVVAFAAAAVAANRFLLFIRSVCACLNCSEDQTRKCRQLMRGREREPEKESAAKFTGSGKFFNSFLLPLLILLLSRRTRGAPLQLMCALYPEIEERVNRKRALKLMMRERKEEMLCDWIPVVSRDFFS